MDKTEARAVLAEVLSKFRSLDYSGAVRLVERPVVVTALGESGRCYRIEIRGAWEGEAGARLRVVASVDDGGWRSMVPLTAGFVLAPDGSLVEEP